MKPPLSPTIMFRGLASAFLQASRGMKLIHDYMSVESVPSASTQQIRDVIAQLEINRRDLLSYAQMNVEDEIAASQRFHVGHHIFQVAVEGICLLAETMQPRIPLVDQPKLQDVVDKLKSLRWDVPLSYMIAIQTGMRTNLKGKDRAILEFPHLPHAVLGIVDKKVKVLVLDETPFGYGNNISLREYAENIKEQMGDSESAECHVLPKDMLANVLERFFSKE